MLILVAGTGVAYTLLPWKTWLPRKEQLPRHDNEAGALLIRAHLPEGIYP